MLHHIISQCHSRLIGPRMTHVQALGHFVRELARHFRTLRTLITCFTVASCWR